MGFNSGFKGLNLAVAGIGTLWWLWRKKKASFKAHPQNSL